jgi:hypothetical protein
MPRCLHLVSSLLLASLLAACGGATSSTSETTPDQNKEEGTPGTPGAPTPNQPKEPTLPKQVGQPDPPPNVAVPFQIIVSNQSFDHDPIDIDVYIDDKHVITGDFTVGNQHTFVPFDFNVATGEHTIKVVSKGGGVAKSSSFKINATKRWAVVMFWHYAKPQGGQPADSPHFSLELYDSQPAFQ